ncbi:hypothetical protein OUZ56_031160 [Daphnia magna]|uniref:Uncharacterized protein n=1 Tax=Daphnia magna TaxID=35525 RepID=A0ABQ9ZTF3_9CRUS|nr:hypothetical protein OUZ56_031160 [Daphnia magna]
MSMSLNMFTRDKTNKIRKAARAFSAFGCLTKGRSMANRIRNQGIDPSRTSFHQRLVRFIQLRAHLNRTTCTYGDALKRICPAAAIFYDRCFYGLTSRTIHDVDVQVLCDPPFPSLSHRSKNTWCLPMLSQAPDLKSCGIKSKC